MNRREAMTAAVAAVAGAAVGVSPTWKPPTGPAHDMASKYVMLTSFGQHTITFPEPITRMIADGDMLIVWTTTTLWTITGNHPPHKVGYHMDPNYSGSPGIANL